LSSKASPASIQGPSPYFLTIDHDYLLLSSATWTLQEILKQYIELGTEVYLVDLCDAVRESFTRSKIWKMLEAHTNDSHVFPTLHGCLQQIHKNGGNIDEAKDRAAKAGRSVDEAVAEFAKVGEWFNT